MQPGVGTSELVAGARRFAAEAHGAVGQLRKYSGQPYEEHLRRVADMVAAAGGDEAMVAAAWLHDVVEDTPVTIEQVERDFGADVATLVDALTDVSRPQDGNRATRKALDRAHLARAPARAQTVKLADLIDNCDDICRHNPRFGRVFLGEMEALLDVLGGGDPALLRRALRTQAKWAERLAAPPEPASPAEASRPALRLEQRRAVRLFARGFRAEDLAEPLRSFDASTAVADALATGVAVVGVRERGSVVGYAPCAELGAGTLAQVMRPVQPTQLLDRDASLIDVVVALTRHELCFITLHDEVVAYAGREQMQGPVGRMWLFGMVTTVEMAVTEGIRQSVDEQAWRPLLTPGRLEKALALQRARAALGRPVVLLDCLQLSDKGRILLAVDQGPRPLFRGASKAESQRLVRDFEDLRNSLAHAQDVVTRDWMQIARLARRVQELAADSA